MCICRWGGDDCRRLTPQDIARTATTLVELSIVGMPAVSDPGLSSCVYQSQTLQVVVLPADYPDSITNVTFNVLCRRTLPPLSMFRELSKKATEELAKVWLPRHRE